MEFHHHWCHYCNFFWIYPKSGIVKSGYELVTGTYSPYESLIENSYEQRSIPVPPILERIAICESGGRQFNEDGTVLKGRLNTHDIGKWQINENYWLAEASRLGVNIYSLEGNTKMAVYIFQRYGTKPWNWSKKCWDKR